LSFIIPDSRQPFNSAALAVFPSRRISQKSQNNKVTLFSILMSLGFQKRSALKDLERIIPAAQRMGINDSL